MDFGKGFNKIKDKEQIKSIFNEFLQTHQYKGSSFLPGIKSKSKAFNYVDCRPVLMREGIYLISDIDTNYKIAVAAISLNDIDYIEIF